MSLCAAVEPGCQQQKLVASDPAADDQFGLSVAISGETVVVGAPFDDGAAGNGQGAAYVFVRNGVVWSQQQKLEPSDASVLDQFGNSVAISEDTIVVGAPFDNGTAVDDQGSAYVFVTVADPPPPDPPPPDSPPVITLKAPISLWPPFHLYWVLITPQMVQQRERRRGWQPHQ